MEVLVVPGASRDEVVGAHGGALRVRVAAPPERGRANVAVAALLARALGVRKADVTLRRGAGNRRKTLHVATLPPGVVVARLRLARTIHDDSRP